MRFSTFRRLPEAEQFHRREGSNSNSNDVQSKFVLVTSEGHSPVIAEEVECSPHLLSACHGSSRPFNVPAFRWSFSGWRVVQNSVESQTERWSADECCQVR